VQVPHQRMRRGAGGNQSPDGIRNQYRSRSCSWYLTRVTNRTRYEIERIRAQLQGFGQVWDASVFYWFQNKKTRTKKRQRHLHYGETSKSGSEKKQSSERMESMNFAQKRSRAVKGWKVWIWHSGQSTKMERFKCFSGMKRGQEIDTYTTYLLNGNI